MDKSSPAKFVDLEIAGMKRLELVVGHGNDNISSDHANWAEAKVLH